jgi:hypothetical protein
MDETHLVLGSIGNRNGVEMLTGSVVKDQRSAALSDILTERSLNGVTIIRRNTQKIKKEAHSSAPNHAIIASLFYIKVVDEYGLRPPNGLPFSGAQSGLR